jgi:hypothetical protein
MGMQCPPRPGPGEGLEAEGPRFGRLDHLPDVDAPAVVEHLQLVDQGDVDRPVGVLQDLARLRHLRVGDPHHLDDGAGVQLRRQLQAVRLEAADHFRDG